MNHDAADASGGVEPHVRPGFSFVGGFVDSIARHVDVADGPGFASAGPDHFVIGGGHRESADSRDGLAVEDRTPGSPAVGGFPNAARCRTHVVGGRIARYPCGGCDTVSHRWSHGAKAKALLHRWTAFLCQSQSAQECHENS